jgi:growth arrest and DNA-damage-inducible protein
MVVEYTKSHSNISTTSVESGIFEMDLNEMERSKGSSQNIGETVRKTLLEAKEQKKLIFGSNNIANNLSPIDSLFFFTAPINQEDHASHLASVLVKAFCMENDIYIIQIDSAEKLSRILGSKSVENSALVMRSKTFNVDDNLDEAFNEESFTDNENILIDYCEFFWKEPVQPIVKLPEK